MQAVLEETQASVEAFEKERDFYFNSTSISPHHLITRDAGLAATDHRTELRSIELFVQGKSNEEGVGEGEAALLKEITEVLYSTEVSCKRWTAQILARVRNPDVS